MTSRAPPMPMIGPAEIAPSLIAFLDIALLRSCPGCLCNTRVVPGVTHGSNRNGPFLVLAIEEEGRCLCVPLYGNAGPNRIQLEQRLKTGPGTGWRDGLSYVSLSEFWIVPFACYVEASHLEFSSPGARQRYAQRRPEALAAIAARKTESGSPFVPIVR